jgi:hypothetical protein
MTVLEKVQALVSRVEFDPRIVGQLSSGEQLVIAMVFDKPKVLNRMGYTMLTAYDRLGYEWTAAALQVQLKRG